jgi:hypothetical protein
MKNAIVTAHALFWASFVLTLTAASPNLALAQNPGDKGVYKDSTNVVASADWIDASAFWTKVNGHLALPDICAIIDNILTNNYSGKYPNGAVIDARGLYDSVDSQVTIACTGTPFDNVNTNPPATTILLPAVTIPISYTWVLPNNTKIVGLGSRTALSANAADGTMLSASTSLTGYMIEMGSSNCPSPQGCTSVAVERLDLDGTQSSTAMGIDNTHSVDSSYVDDVNFHHFSLTGLHIAAANSGPYSNVTYAAKSAATCNSSDACPMCVDLEAQTKGLHGVTCLGNATTGQKVTSQYGPPGIQVNASNNSIEDVHIEAFWDGIEVGNTSTTQPIGNIVVSNVTGSESNDCSPCQVTNVVHICGQHPHDTTDFGECQVTTGTVEDVTILQVTSKVLSSSHAGTTTVEDDATSTSIQACFTCELPFSTPFYGLGEPDGGPTAAYSRFAGNPAQSGGNYGPQTTPVPTWSVGSASINGTPCLTVGALYSNIVGSSGNIIYVCTYTSGGFVWKPIL